MAKSIADKADVGLILLDVNKNDTEGLKDWIANNGYEMPDIKMSVYKNRRGEYKSIYLWGKKDLGTCRIKWEFATTWNYLPVEMANLSIKSKQMIDFTEEDKPQEKTLEELMTFA